MNHRRAALLTVVAVGIAAAGALTLFKRMTPVSLESAIDRFREEDAGASRGKQTIELSQSDTKNRAVSRDGKPSGSARASERSEVPDSATGAGVRGHGSTRSVDVRPPVGIALVAPAEGVYTYSGSGWESIGPARRDYPTTSRRLITHEGRGVWLEHHIFSEEREVWSQVGVSDEGRFVFYQRNYIAIGPYEEDVKLEFDSPLFGVLFPPHVGQQWSGDASGTTDGERFEGTFDAEVLDHTSLSIGGSTVPAWVTRLHLTLRGAYNGDVTVTRWFSPQHGLNIKEDYKAEVSEGPLTFRGEWSVTLQSLTPRT